MEEELEKPKVLEDPKVKNLKKIRRFSQVILAIFIISAVITSLYYLLGQKNFLPEVPLSNLNTQASPTPALVAEDKIVAKVGRENIYQADINYYLSLYFPTALTDAARYQEYANLAFEKVAEDSIILQEGEKTNLFKLDSTTFNLLTKDNLERNKLIEKTKKGLEDKYVSKISGEKLSLWFRNPSYPEPKIGYDQAKKIVKQKMDNLYTNIKSGNMTLFQAANIIRADKSLNDIDQSYQSNAYVEFKNRSASLPVIQDDPDSDKIVWSLKPGEISPILTIHYNDPDPIEIYFSIIKVTSKTESVYKNTEDMLADLKKKYEIIKY